MAGETLTTTDHDTIREWAEARGGEPAAVSSTTSGDDAGVIRLEFPDNRYSDADALETVTWDEWFAKFEDSGLALLYQETTADGAQSTFNKLVSRD